MLPSERARITRRRRITHLGIGGIVLAAASVTAIDRESAPAEPPAPVTAAPAPPILGDFPPRPVPHRASRSHPRTKIHHKARAATPPPPAPTPVGWPWPQLAGCESGGHWSEVTGNGFLWGLQFVASTWDANRGSLPTAESYLARGAAPTPAEQIQVGKRVQAGAGWGAWPHCAAELGLL